MFRSRLRGLRWRNRGRPVKMAGMSQIPRQREIVDRRVLADELEALVQHGEPPRAKVAAILKTALDAGRATVRARFDQNNRGTEAARELLSLIHISEPTRQAEISYAVFC